MSYAVMPLAFGMPGPFEMLIIGIVAVLLFGRRLPEVGRSLGQGIKQFKSGLAGIDTDVDNNSSRYASSSRSKSYSDEDREEATAPKFEPPVEQQQETTVS